MNEINIKAIVGYYNLITSNKKIKIGNVLGGFHIGKYKVILYLDDNLETLLISDNKTENSKYYNEDLDIYFISLENLIHGIKIGDYLSFIILTDIIYLYCYKDSLDSRLKGLAKIFVNENGNKIKYNQLYKDFIYEYIYMIM